MYIVTWGQEPSCAPGGIRNEEMNTRNVRYGNYVWYKSWWRHEMEALIFRVTRPLPGERWIPVTKASDEKCWCFLWSAPEWLSKQSRRRVFEMASRSLWRHCNGEMSNVFKAYRYGPDSLTSSMGISACHCITLAYFDFTLHRARNTLEEVMCRFTLKNWYKLSNKFRDCTETQLPKYFPALLNSLISAIPI